MLKCKLLQIGQGIIGGDGGSFIGGDGGGVLSEHGLVLPERLHRRHAHFPSRVLELGGDGGVSRPLQARLLDFCVRLEGERQATMAELELVRDEYDEAKWKGRWRQSPQREAETSVTGQTVLGP